MIQKVELGRPGTMALVVLSGVPGSGKTRLAQHLKPIFEATGRECVIVSEPSVEDGTFSASRRETAGRSDFKAAIRRNISPEKIVIADGMNFIKGFRYELYAMAREIGLGFCCAFCDVPEEVARERSKDRYPEATLSDLIGRMEKPSERNKWDRPLIIVKDADDKLVQEQIVSHALSKSSKLAPKKATSKAIGSSAQVNTQIDQAINAFCNELLKVQQTVPLGSTIVVCGAKFVLKKQLNSGQLKRARRDFAARAKTISDASNITQLFADSLEVLF
ncbi:protein KTI12 [Histomonas meleagridis]|uniref:protein KTI12-like n=1 Tax=Histomonas meleagridis TaxID=135588 RepID=UPI00355A8C30|nr:protein KTI12 [Histomonas meleagridis]KAH0801692.1 protein KTI12-like [Histomonas meleagridis]